MNTQVFKRLIGMCIFCAWLMVEASHAQAQSSGATPANFKIAFIGDQGLGPDPVAVLNLIKNEGAQVIVHSGDFDYADNPQAWDAQINSVFSPDFPYFASRGNHDTDRFYGAGGYQEFLAARLNRLGITWDGDLGVKSSFMYQGIFFLLTEPTSSNGYHLYVRDKLAQNSAMWRVSSWHRNMRLMQVGGKSDATGWGIYEESRRGGAIIATAHEHSYSRTHLLSSCQFQTVASRSDTLILTKDMVETTGADEGKSFVFVSGLGGESIRGQELSGDWWASIYTSTQGAVSGALFGVFNYNGNPNLAKFYFKAVNGAVPDNFYVRSAVQDGLLLTVNTQGSGTVQLNPSGGVYEDGTEVTLTAVPANGWEFSGWSGDLSGSANPATILMNDNKQVTATFSPQQFSLNLTIDGSGTVALNPPGGVYGYGTVVTLTANPDPGWTFSGWGSDLNGLANPTNLTMNANKNVTAAFLRNDPPVAVNDSYNVDEDNTLNVAAPGVLGNDRDPDGDDLLASKVNNPSHGTLTFNSDGSFTYQPQANFNETDNFTYTAQDGRGGSSTATVTVIVNPVNDAPVAVNDSYNIDEGSSLDVATPGILTNDSDADGDGLSASLLSAPTNGTLALNSDGSFTYTPNSTGLDSFTYTADDGNGGTAIGTVTINVTPAVVAHEETQTGRSSNQNSVTTSGNLQAVSGHLYLAAISTRPNVTVTSVSGLGLNWTLVKTQCSGRNYTAVSVWKAQGTPSGNGTVTASFSTSPTNAVIAVSRYSRVHATSPVGNIVSGNTRGVNGACSGGSDRSSYSFNLTTTVNGAVAYGAVAMRNRTHTPGSGYAERAEVRQGSSSNQASAAVEDKVVATASTVVVNGTFSGSVDWAVVALEIRPRSGAAPTQFTLTVNTIGSGNVSLNPAGGIYDSGTVVTLTANPASGYQFSGWSGDLSGSANPAMITMNSNKNVTATFTQLPTQFTLTVNTVGSGDVSLNPAGEIYDSGTMVTLTANPASGYQFSGWSGDLSGSANPAMITMNSNKNVTATFTQLSPTQFALTVNTAGSGSVSLNPAGGLYDSGTVVTLTANPESGYQFSGWSGDLSGSANPTTITMNSNKSATATFTPIGSGGAIVYEETRTGGSSASSTVTTSASLTGVSGHLYMAAISTKSHVNVTSVSGLGLTWTLLKAQCAGRNQTGVSVWRAQGTPSTSGTVTATFSSAPKNAVIAVSRYSGVDGANSVGNVVSGNTVGTNATCSGGVDNSSYSFNLTTTVNGAVVYGAVAMRNRTHSPGTGYIERVEFGQGSSGDQASVAVMDKIVASAATVTVNGTFSSSVDWAVVALEIKPSSPSAKLAASEEDTPRPLAAIPADYQLEQNYPNPFNPSTTIAFGIPQAGEVTIAIYNLKGQLICTLVSGAVAAGRHQVVWDGTDSTGEKVASGVYIYRLEAKGFVANKKLVLMK